MEEKKPTLLEVQRFGIDLTEFETPALWIDMFGRDVLALSILIDGGVVISAVARTGMLFLAGLL